VPATRAQGELARTTELAAQPQHHRIGVHTAHGTTSPGDSVKVHARRRAHWLRTSSVTNAPTSPDAGGGSLLSVALRRVRRKRRTRTGAPRVRGRGRGQLAGGIVGQVGQRITRIPVPS
jgi:hypothetical protein